jgi:hypothetical protein
MLNMGQLPLKELEVRFHPESAVKAKAREVRSR